MINFPSKFIYKNGRILGPKVKNPAPIKKLMSVNMHFSVPCRAFRTFLPFLATVFLSSCAKENSFDCVKSTGRIVTEKRDLPAFNELKVSGNAEVILVPDSVYYAEVRCGENLQKKVETTVTNQILEIRNLNKCNWVRSYDKPMEITLHLPQLKTISHDGFGTIRSAGPLKFDQLFLHVTGAGDLDLETETGLLWLDMYELGNVKLRGQTKDLKAMVMSSGKLECGDLRATEASLLVAGDGDATVNVSGTLGATLTGRGNVYYFGSPALVNREGAGKGQVIHKEN
jgi:hypothetical protein